MMNYLMAAFWAAFSFPVLFAQDVSLIPVSSRAAPDAAVAVNTWTQGTPMPTARMGPFAGAVGNKVYVVGGQSGSGTILGVNEIYDTVADTWSFGAPMPTPRLLGASAVVNNILYAIGGQGASARQTAVEAYDPLTDRWTARAPLPSAIDSMYAAVVNNIIYVVGGYNGNRITTVFAFDPAGNKWSSVAPLKVGKSQSALGVFNGTIVSAGGLLANGNASTDAEGYNVASNTWTTLAPLPSARQAGCFESAGSLLFFAGGHGIDNGSPVATMDAFHADTNTWETGFPTMPHAAVNMASASAGGKLYCFGGSNAGFVSAGNIFNYVQIYQPDLPPSISTSGLVSASAFGQFSSVAPGSWIEIYGASLSNTTRGWTLADFTGLTAPTSLDGVSVSIGGKQAFIDYVNPGQINALLPSDTPLGNQQIIVTNGSKSSAPYPVTVNATQAGLLAPPNFNVAGVQYAVAIFTDGAYALPAGSLAGVNTRPARPGDVLTLYGVGFGPVIPDTPAGQLAQQLTTLALPFQMNIGGAPASLLYYGLAPNFTGLYQFNLMVPSVPAGTEALTFTINGVSGTQVLSIPIAQ